MENDLIEKIFYEVRTYGFSLVENFISNKKCKEYRDEIDRIINEKEIKYYYGADHHDHRIYGIEKFSDQFHFLFNDHQINETLQKLYNTNNPAITLLAQHVFSKKGNQGSGGGWHRDSIRKQFKVFIYFNNIFSETGPLQLVSNSHKASSKFFDLLRNKRSFFELNPTKPNYILKNIHEVICKEGSIFFCDTSAIHRGKPNIKNDRYSCTFYAYEKAIPNHILNIIK